MYTYLIMYAYLLLAIEITDLKLQCHHCSAFMRTILFLLKRFFGLFATFLFGIHDLIGIRQVTNKGETSW